MLDVNAARRKSLVDANTNEEEIIMPGPFGYVVVKEVGKKLISKATPVVKKAAKKAKKETVKAYKKAKPIVKKKAKDAYTKAKPKVKKAADTVKKKAKDAYSKTKPKAKKATKDVFEKAFTNPNIRKAAEYGTAAARAEKRLRDKITRRGRK
jgi:predicted solute-binding protein